MSLGPLPQDVTHGHHLLKNLFLLSDSIPYKAPRRSLEPPESREVLRPKKDDITWIPLVSEVGNLVIKEIKFVKQDLPLMNPHCCDQLLLAFNSWNNLCDFHRH